MKGIYTVDHLYHVCNYIIRPDKCEKGYIGATNACLPIDRRYMSAGIYNNLMNVAKFYNQEHTRLGLHIIISFAPSECNHLDRSKVLRLAYQFAEQEFPNYMTFFAVHDLTEQIHFHMIVSCVMLGSGKKFGIDSRGERAIGHKFVDLMKQFVPEEDIVPILF